MSHGRPR